MGALNLSEIGQCFSKTYCVYNRRPSVYVDTTLKPVYRVSIWTYNTPPVSRPISDYPAHIAIVPHISVVLSRGFVLCHALTGFRRAPLCRFIALSVPSCIFAEGLPSQFFCNGMDYPCGYSPASDSAGRGWQCRAGRLFLRLEASLIRRETYKNRPAR